MGGHKTFPLFCKEGSGEVESCEGDTPVLHEQALWAGDSTPPSLPLQRGGGSDHFSSGRPHVGTFAP